MGYVSASRKVGFKEEWLREEPWRAIETAMKNAFENGSTSDLREGKTLKLKMKPKEEYQTPTGRIEFYATGAEQMGASPLPKQYQLLGDEGFVLLSSAVAKYTHTQFQDVYGPIASTVLVSPQDAKVYSLIDKGIVELFNDFGSIRVRTEISNSVPRGVLWSPREFTDLNGKPQNTIISDASQNLGGGSTFNSTIVKIRKK